MTTENYTKNRLSFFRARKLSSIVLSGLLAWSIPGLVTAEVEPDTVITTDPPTTASGALVKTGFSDAQPLPGDAAAAVSGAVQHAAVAVAMSGRIAVTGSSLVRTVLSDPEERGAQIAAVPPGDYAVPGHGLSSSEKPASPASADPDNPQAPMTQKDESAQLPYALVLALVALIGLVPVSRRAH